MNQVKFYNKISKKLPELTKKQSNLLCRITGQLMDEHNPPIALPNGQIFSKKGI